MALEPATEEVLAATPDAVQPGRGDLGPLVECGHWQVNAVMAPKIRFEKSRTCRLSQPANGGWKASVISG